jgi:hypothetical protein
VMNERDWSGYGLNAVMVRIVAPSEIEADE